MKPELTHINTLESESQKINVQSWRFASKGNSPVLLSEVSAWDEDQNIEISSFNPISARNNSQHKDKSEGLIPAKSVSPNLPCFNRLKQSQINAVKIPKMISMYEASKTSTKYKQFFEQNKPLRISKIKLRFPAINDKSLLSVYVAGNPDFRKKSEKEKL